MFRKLRQFDDGSNLFWHLKYFNMFKKKFKI